MEILNISIFYLWESREFDKIYCKWLCRVLRTYPFYILDPYMLPKDEFLQVRITSGVKYWIKWQVFHNEWIETALCNS